MLGHPAVMETQSQGLQGEGKGLTKQRLLLPCYCYVSTHVSL